jgi:hypothetical protein
MRQRVRGMEKVRDLALPYQQQLTSYALAAAAAGVSVLALTAPSEAEINLQASPPGNWRRRQL